MRKIFIAFVFFAVIMLSVLCFAGCGDECEHSFEEWTVSVQPTCTEQGEKERECSKCGEVQYEKVEMLDHKYDTANLVWNWNGYDAATVTFTCTSGATHTGTVNATVTGQITTLATCTANGVKTYTATAKINDTTYTQTKTETLTSPGHVEEIIGAIAPTCTEAGLTEGKKCKECQEILTAQETVNATGHKWDTNNIVWSWNGYESAGVKLTCVSDSTHTAIAGAVISKVTKEPSANEEGYISYTATVTINGQSYTDTKTVSKSLKNTFDSAMDALINTSNGTLVEKYVNYTAAGVEDGSFSYVFELTEEALKCTYTSGSRSYVEYYTYENEVLYVYESVNGQWVKRVKEHTGYNYKAFDKAFGKEDLWITIKNLYPSLSYDVQTGTFSIAEVIIENERYINGSLVIKDGIVTKVAATRVNEDGTMRSLCFELSGYGMVSVTLPEANQGNPTDKDDNTNKKESEGLEFILSSDSSYYIVKGIGECTDTDIVIPSTYQELPVKAIASYAFARQKITSVTTQDNMLGIDSYAFYGCSELEKIVISNDVFLIQLSAFFECKALDTIIVNEKNPYYIAQDNVLYIKPGVTIEDTQITGKTLFLFPEGFAERSFTIPADVSNIAPCAFANCINLASIEIPDNVTKIGQLAFYGCTSLYDIKIGDSVELIESDAFECTGYYEDRSSWQNGLLYIGKYLIKATGNYESYTI